MGEREKILIADDMEIPRESLKGILEASDFNVVATAASVNEVKKVVIKMSKWQPIYVF